MKNNKNLPKVLGITGGIGSGKTTIARLFQEHFDIALYMADVAAKEVIATNVFVQKEITEIFGNKAFINGFYNRSYISSRVFESKMLLEKLNTIVHPAVQEHFNQWLLSQTSPYVIRESAILFESNSYKTCHWTLTVIANMQSRIQRVMQRDGVDENKVLSIINNQWSDTQRIALSNFVIENTIMQENLEKIREVHFKILKTMNTL